MSETLSGARWELCAVDGTALRGVANGLHPVAARCFALRGARSSADVDRLVHPSRDHLHDPYAMAGMHAAVERLERAARDGEHVRVITDYDVDGTTSSLILQATLRLRGLKAISFHIPDRMREGYGFSVEAADQAADDGVHLIVTADIGVKDHAAVTRARARGLDVIVLDHHLPAGDSVPADANAVLCPPQDACDYPNPALAACGVSLKLAQAMLAGHAKYDAILDSVLKLAAIGTVADVVNVFTPENRAIVALGLKSLNRGPHSPGLDALLAAAGLRPGRITEQDLGFRIGPRINAAGRIASARSVVELFETRDRGRAMVLAQQLNEQNLERQAIQRRIVREALAMLDGVPVPPFIVVAGQEKDGWHQGVVGIVAARLRDRLYRPAAVIALTEDGGRGSVRSTSEVHAVHALDAAADLLERYGGHPAAAGFSVPTERIDALRERLGEAALAQAGGEMPSRTYEVDAEVPLEGVDRRLYGDLQRLAPFGKGNRSPYLAVQVPRMHELRILKDQHLRARLGPAVDAIWWGGGRHADALDGPPVELLGHLEINEHRGVERLQLNVFDARVG